MPVSKPRTDGRHRLVERPRLTSKLREALESGSLLVTAGAGFGKTTVLERALRQRGGGAVAWIACTETDREPGRNDLFIEFGNDGSDYIEFMDNSVIDVEVNNDCGYLDASGTRVTVTATDTAGNAATAKRTVRLKR